MESTPSNPIEILKRVALFKVLSTQTLLTSLTTKRFLVNAGGDIQEEFLPPKHNTAWKKGRRWRAEEVEILLMEGEKEAE